MKCDGDCWEYYVGRIGGYEPAEQDLRVIATTMGYIFLCHECFVREMNYRLEQNRTKSYDQRLTIQLWQNLLTPSEWQKDLDK